ncbi:hypothetical protein GEMRC1_007188 [Eukaryota sp. GEM-RC1]
MKGSQPVVEVFVDESDEYDTDSGLSDEESSTPTSASQIQLLSTLPRHTLFQKFIPPSWYFISFAEATMSCLRFYQEPVTLEFIQAALSEVKLINKARNIPLPLKNVTTTWKTYIKLALQKFESSFVFSEVIHGTRCYFLTPKGRTTFTAVGANLGSDEGTTFLKYSKGKLEADRKLPKRFKYVTVFELLGEPVPPFRSPSSLPVKKTPRRRFVKTESRDRTRSSPTRVQSDLEPPIKRSTAPVNTPTGKLRTLLVENLTNRITGNNSKLY